MGSHHRGKLHRANGQPGAITQSERTLMTEYVQLRQPLVILVIVVLEGLKCKKHRVANTRTMTVVQPKVVMENSGGHHVIVR